MNLEDLQDAWKSEERTLGRDVHLDRAAAAAVLHVRATADLTRHRRWLRVEIAALVAAMLWLGSFVHRSWGDAALVVSAAGLQLACLGLLAAAVHQLVLLAGVDHAWPLVRLQERLDRLAIARVRATFWTVAAGVLLWLPALAVVVRAVLGHDLFAADDPGAVAWLGANLGLGVVVLAAAAAAARRYGRSVVGSPRLRRLVLDFGGHNLRRARASLAELAAFAAEPE